MSATQQHTYPVPILRDSYAVTATREYPWWILEVEGVGTSQCRNLTQAEATVREMVELMTEADASDVTITIEVVGREGQKVKDVQRAVREAAEAQARAAALTRSVVSDLLEESHLSKADVAVALGVSKQRVTQLTNA